MTAARRILQDYDRRRRVANESKRRTGNRAIIYYRRPANWKPTKSGAKTRIGTRATCSREPSRSERREERRGTKRERRKCAYYTRHAARALAFPLSQFPSAFSFKRCLGRNNVVWRAATGRDTCYRCQSPRVCRDSSCKLKIPFISAPPPLPPPRSRGDATAVHSETTYFPRAVNKVVAVRGTLESEQFQIYGAALGPFSPHLSRKDAVPLVYSFISLRHVR